MISNPSSDFSQQFKEQLETLPGGPLVWFVFWLEILTFALFFLGFAWVGRSENAMFQAGQALLHPAQGTLNTLILLTGSWMAARAVCLSRLKRSFRPWLIGTGFSGLIFISVKLWEYQQVYAHGISLSTNMFWFFYLFLTLLHNAHVALGVGLMFYLAWKFRTGSLLAEQQTSLEATAVYWHLVDIIWVLLFPLVYFSH